MNATEFAQEVLSLPLYGIFVCVGDMQSCLVLVQNKISLEEATNGLKRYGYEVDDVSDGFFPATLIVRKD